MQENDPLHISEEDLAAALARLQNEMFRYDWAYVEGQWEGRAWALNEASWEEISDYHCDYQQDHQTSRVTDVASCDGEPFFTSSFRPPQHRYSGAPRFTSGRSDRMHLGAMCAYWCGWLEGVAAVYWALQPHVEPDPTPNEAEAA